MTNWLLKAAGSPAEHDNGVPLKMLTSAVVVSYEGGRGGLWERLTLEMFSLKHNNNNNNDIKSEQNELN